MLKLDLKIAVRNLLRYKFVSSITIFGLAIGIACCTVVLLFVSDEFSYDRHHADSERIFRVVKDFVNDDGSRVSDATTPPALAPALQQEIPEIESVVRIMPGWGAKFYVKYEDKKFLEENIYRVDSNFFEIFTTQFIAGNANDAFTHPKSILLTESTAKKYFGNEDPMSQSLEIDDRGSFTVTGIISDVPRTAHFKYDFLLSIRSLRGNIDADWGYYNFYTYIKLIPNTDIDEVTPAIQELFKKHQPDNLNIFYSQALTEIHLYSHLKWELEANSDATYIYIIIVIALFIIVIACINYINLSTARSSLRAKEIGMRKVSGAEKFALIKQFITESILIALLATLVAIGLTQLILPAVNNITGKELTLLSETNLRFFLWLLLSALIIGIAAGSFPAFYLASLDPAKVLKGIKSSPKYDFSLRKVLVIIQFTISIALIIGAMIISNQVNYIQSAKLGYEKEQVLMISDVDYLPRSQRSAIRNEFLTIPGVLKVATSDGILGGQNWTNDVRMKGSENSQLLNFLNVDGDFFDVMNLTLKEGRELSPEFTSDTADAIILNETAVRQLGVPSPVLGQQIVWAEDEDTTYYAKVIGVVEDFHFTSLRNEIRPFAFVTDNNRQSYFAVKLGGSNVSETISHVKAIWDKNVSERPFQYFFLDETFDKLYITERNFKTVFFCITCLIIIIACLGLFGLSSFMIAQRTKEIGIRKVLGATISGIVALLSKDFLKLLFLSAVIAFPLAWWGMRAWLENFAYRININWWVFLIAGMLALSIAFLTISFQAIKAAIMNPVSSLRTE